MKPISLATIRARFLLLILAVLTPALGLVLYTAHEQRVHMIEDAEEDITALAQLASLEEERLIAEARALLMGLAMSWEVKGGHPDNCRELLQRMLANNPHYRNFGVVDSAGIVRCSALPFRPGLDLSDRLYVRRAIERRGFGVGGYQVGRITGVQTINFGYPVFSESGRIRAVVYGALGLEALGRLAQDAAQVLPEGAVLTKIDEDGTVLARHPEGEPWVGKEAPEFAMVRNLLRGGPGCIRSTNQDGDPSLLSFAPVRSGLWAGDVYVVLCAPEAVMFAEINRGRLRNLALLGLAAVLALLIAWVLANMVFVRPMKRLVDATASLRGGDLGTRIGPARGRGELGELGRAFDDMAATLQQRQTERDEAEAALRRSEHEFRSLWAHAPYGIVRIDATGQILLANRALAEMLGYESESSLLGMNLAADFHVDPEEFARLMERHKDDDSVTGLRTDYRRRNGQIVRVLCSGRRLHDDKGTPTGFEIFAEDETERRTLEEQLRQAQKMEAVGRLAGGVAHDFNNLLGVMLGYSNMMLAELAADDPNHERVMEIREATERAANLTQQLLIISRRQVVKPRVLDLNGIVVGMESMFRSLVGESVRVKIVAAEDLAAVRADPAQVEQVLLNLVVNARDAMPEGGALTLATENVDLAAPIVDEGGTVLPGRYVRMTVTDTGMGMDKDTRDRIFEPFFTTKGPGKGSGLGLSMVLGIVERGGGKIRILSELGHGARFEIYLPAVLDEPVTEAMVAPVEPKRSGPETILLVEDEESLRTMTRRFLEGEGYHTLEARNGTHALELAQRHQGTIHLLLTDVVMPNLSGREVAERILKLRPETRVLFVSGYADDIVIDQGLLMEGAAFLAKPFAPDALLAKVREVLGAG